LTLGCILLKVLDLSISRDTLVLSKTLLLFLVGVVWDTLWLSNMRLLLLALGVLGLKFYLLAVFAAHGAGPLEIGLGPTLS
jgi:hypothetical protein